MASIEFTNAFYIKLGRAGIWEQDSIITGKLRLGWRGQSIEDINAGRWDLIEQQLRRVLQDKPRGVATRDLHALRMIAKSEPDDVWVTFHQAKLWWARLEGPVEEDGVSKFRRTVEPWKDTDVGGRLLSANELPGRIAQYQGFRGTACRFKCPDVLRRILNGTPSQIAAAIRANRRSLAGHLAQAIKQFHWKDFEILVDLVFRGAGWVRVSVLGQQAKACDLELREPVTWDRYVVQVKSRADKAELEDTAACFSPADFRRVYFVVHSPEADLEAATDIPEHVASVGPDRLGELALQVGLAGWLEDKIA